MDSLNKISPAANDLGLGDILQDQVKVKSEAARQSALQKNGASDAQLSMSAPTRALYNFLGGSSALDLLIQ